MGFLSLFISFWGYALETIVYTLHLMPYKLVPLTPREMWKGCKPSLQHIHIWGCPTHVLKPMVDKLEARFEVCLFVGYLKEVRGYYYYIQINQKVIVITFTRGLYDE